MDVQVVDPALDKLLAAAVQADQEGNRLLARGLLLRATRLYPTAISVWEALATVESGAQRAMCHRWIEHLHVAAPAPLVQNRRARRRQGWYAVSVTALTMVLWLSTTLLYRDRILPGVWIGHVDVGGLTPAIASQKVLAASNARGQQRITITAEGRSWTLPHNHLLQPTTTGIPAAYRIGHSGPWLDQAIQGPWHLLGHTSILSTTEIDSAALAAVVDYIGQALDRPALDAHLVRTPSGVALSPAQQGALVDRAALSSQLAAVADAADEMPAIIKPRLVAVAPRMTGAMLTPLRDQLNTLHARPLVVFIGGQRWPVDRAALVNYGVDSTPLAVDRTAVTRLVTRLALLTDRQARPSQLVRDGVKVRAITPGVPGALLDKPHAVDLLAAAILAPEAELQLTSSTQLPPPGEAEQLGLLAEIGHGDSQFVTYSSPDRDANVLSGGQDIDGVLIAPGEEFSFTRTVGEITWEKGYRWGDMIEAGQVRRSLGGGICQVSTTVFRAAMRSGLPITERHSHSWRLPWYEVDSPPGMDATISLGGPDLRFRNDTPAHILIKVETDLVHKRQHAIIYGTPTDRTVELEPQLHAGVAIERRIRVHSMVVADEMFHSSYTQ